jgi:hypothetical protein
VGASRADTILTKTSSMIGSIDTGPRGRSGNSGYISGRTPPKSHAGIARRGPPTPSVVGRRSDDTRRPIGTSQERGPFHQTAPCGISRKPIRDRLTGAAEMTAVEGGRVAPGMITLSTVLASVAFDSLAKSARLGQMLPTGPSTARQSARQPVAWGSDP